MHADCDQYDSAKIEEFWQRYWEKNATFRAEDPTNKPKFYGLDMFPYPSGAGLHIGHPEGYTATDIVCRFKKACGFNVLHPMGWDAFGLPAEQYAIKTGTHPAQTTASNVKNFRKQIKQIGFAIDWSREINTTDPDYYRWTQWIFLQLFRLGLVYVDERPVWWCPELRSVLANEEVVQGRSEVGNHPVERRNLSQVVLRITAYADRLLDGLKDLDWPDSTKRQQRAWIGKSEGAEVEFTIDVGLRPKVTVFTTRPDTLFGATYLVLAPEHPLVDSITSQSRREEVEAYRESARSKSDLDRTDLAKEKTGIFTGAHAINPVNGGRIPVWVADYVLASYGTGAIMAVPAHDERDFEFASEFQLPVQRVIEPKNSGGNGHSPELPFTEKGHLVHSGDFSGLPSDEAAGKITHYLESQDSGKASVNYRLRDWIFSRQRYWGEPIPLVWVAEESWKKAADDPESPVGRCLPIEPVTCLVDGAVRFALPVPPERLPLTLPEVESFQPSGTGESPLAAIPDWLHVWFNVKTGETRPLSEGDCPGDDWVSSRRETNTMPQWAGSCWYQLRYMDPDNSNALVDPEKERYWQSPDLYIGGAEHAVLHLLYARFWHKVLFDVGAVSTDEPYRKLFHQGILLGEDGEKMSKSRGNVINPEVVIDEYGADSLRLFEMFLGPLEDMKPWNPSGIEGVSRFLKKVWRSFIGMDGKKSERIQSDVDETAENRRILHETIHKVTEDIRGLRLNTAISQMMICINQLAKSETIHLETAKQFIQLLAPFAPHLSEEIWSRLGGIPSISMHPWPEADLSLLTKDTVTYVIQVNGKVRAEMVFDKEAGKDMVLAEARTAERVSAFLEGKEIRKEIFVPGKIVNFVAN
ncbi:MAG: leucine--tRNA ligase [Verrucomicrobiota bacterium]